MKILMFFLIFVMAFGAIVFLVSWFIWAWSTNEEKQKKALRVLPWGLVLLLGGLATGLIIGITM